MYYNLYWYNPTTNQGGMYEKIDRERVQDVVALMLSPETEIEIKPYPITSAYIEPLPDIGFK